MLTRVNSPYSSFFFKSMLWIYAMLYFWQVGFPGNTWSGQPYDWAEGFGLGLCGQDMSGAGPGACAGRSSKEETNHNLESNSSSSSTDSTSGSSDSEYSSSDKEFSIQEANFARGQLKLKISARRKSSTSQTSPSADEDEDNILSELSDSSEEGTESYSQDTEVYILTKLYISRVRN